MQKKDRMTFIFIGLWKMKRDWSRFLICYNNIYIIKEKAHIFLK
jgi:hypothetical protein